MKNKNTKKRKKAQMEIMGLALIVILVTLAVLFAVQFILLREPSEARKEFIHKELASNTVSTLLSTNTECNNNKISELLIDCADDRLLDCRRKGSCEFAHDTIKDILEDTLSKWNKEYYLTVKRNNQTLPHFNPIGTPCPGEKITSSPCCILPTEQGPMNINLDICG